MAQAYETGEGDDALSCLSLKEPGEQQMSTFTMLSVVLLIAWLGGVAVFPVASGLIDWLLVLAVISFIMHFVMGGGRSA